PGVATQLSMTAMCGFHPARRPFLLCRRPPSRSTLFPYTTLFRSGQVAKRQAVTNPDRTISSIKRHMGTDYRVTIDGGDGPVGIRSEEHTSELQSRENLVCRLLLEKKKERTESKRGKR